MLYILNCTVLYIQCISVKLKKIDYAIKHKMSKFLKLVNNLPEELIVLVLSFGKKI